MATKMTVDGNTAVSHVAYAFSDVAAIYPITPSSPMAEVADEWAAHDRKNLFGQTVHVTEMQSEAGAAGAVHGSLAAGALTTTFTASQGLLLMIPNMYKISGELLPTVFHVSARALAYHALSIFGDHSDVMSCRQTGFAMLASNSVQEAMDMALVAHVATLKSSVPFLHFFDGFRTSHEIQKIDGIDYDEMAKIMPWDKVEEFRARALNPEHPHQGGTAQNPDIYFQGREAGNKYYNATPAIVEEVMKQVGELTGRHYNLFDYVGAPDAEYVLVAMGSGCDVADEAIAKLVSMGQKVGLIKVHLYRPFSIEHFVKAIPASCKKIAVLDRTKESGSLGEPLYLDVCAALAEAGRKDIQVVGGRYGLGSKEFTPTHVKAVFDNLAGECKNHFTVGIVDDVTNTSLPVGEQFNAAPEGAICCKFYGLGSDGTVGANKNSIKIIGDHTDMYAQGYFAYDSKKSGGLTVSHLRFGPKPIKSTYYISKADFVACHKASYVNDYDMVQDLKDGGSFLLNCEWTDEELDEKLPGKMKKYIADHNINFYTIDGVKLGKEIGLGKRINTILQSAFFSIANIIPSEQAIQYMKDAATKSYSKKGQNIVDMNHAAIERGAKEYHKVNVPESWKNCTDDTVVNHVSCSNPDTEKYVNDVLVPANKYKGNQLPVSTFVDMADGTVASGSAAYEKRGVAIDVPEWNPDNCIQCNFCSYVCPHAAIRPVALTEEEAANFPKSQKLKDMTGMPGMKFAVTVSAYDCQGCGSCANVCPGMKGNKALVMKPMDTQVAAQEGFDEGLKYAEKPEVLAKFKPTTVKGSQFKQPLLEFSGACAGCGETPYAKLITQLFGDRMYIANATGCSSIWGASAPSTPYTRNKRCFGPAWDNSLFEDNAEFGYGMTLAQNAIRGRLLSEVEALIASDGASDELKAAGKAFLDTKDSSMENREPTDALIAELEKNGSDEAKKILADKDYLAKKSTWILGGDGWCYDIGFGGVDHVLASGADVNILCFDTEVYSNTGGQASKSTPAGAVAQFAATGKATKKKDLPGIAMTYGYVYVAHIAMGADMNQCIKALQEAESYHGPSIVIAYAPCINHGIKGGMSIAQTEEKKAVQAGYWKLFRYDPRRAEAGQNPFQLDSKEPTASYRDFLMGEVRYNSLTRAFPERAEKLFAASEADAKRDYEHLVALSKDPAAATE